VSGRAILSANEGRAEKKTHGDNANAKGCTDDDCILQTFIPGVGPMGNKQITANSFLYNQNIYFVTKDGIGKKWGWPVQPRITNSEKRVAGFTRNS
jgi:hypothetical protein